MNRDFRKFIMLVAIAVASLMVFYACNYRAAAATATCITRPNIADRSGWWMYRIDRANGRRCWYQGVRRGARVAHRARAYRYRHVRQVRLDEEVARPVSPDRGSLSSEPPREPVITILRTIVDPPPHGLTPHQRIDDVFRTLRVQP